MSWVLTKIILQNCHNYEFLLEKHNVGYACCYSIGPSCAKIMYILHIILSLFFWIFISYTPLTYNDEAEAQALLCNKNLGGHILQYVHCYKFIPEMHEALFRNKGIMLDEMT